MKKDLHIRPFSIILAAVFLSLFGSIWYGVLFRNVQMESHGYTPEDYASSHPAWYVGGIVISLFIAWGWCHNRWYGKRNRVLKSIRYSKKDIVRINIKTNTI